MGAAAVFETAADTPPTIIYVRHHAPLVLIQLIRVSIGELIDVNGNTAIPTVLRNWA